MASAKSVREALNPTVWLLEMLSPTTDNSSVVELRPLALEYIAVKRLMVFFPFLLLLIARVL
jgi:hypothetical protein